VKTPEEIKTRIKELEKEKDDMDKDKGFLAKASLTDVENQADRSVAIQQTINALNWVLSNE